MSRVHALRDDVLLEAMTTGHRAHWMRRAAAFEAAKPRVGEHHGQATPEQLRDQWRRLDAIARACRARAEVCDVNELSADLRNVLEEVAA